MPSSLASLDSRPLATATRPTTARCTTLLDGFPDIQRLKTGVFRDRVRYAEALKRRLAEARHRKDADAAVVVDLENTLLQAAGKQGGTCG